MRIAYISGAAVPSEAANSVHVMKMCQALARTGHQVSLIARSNRSGPVDPFEYYGVDACFRLKTVRRVPSKVVDGFLYPLRAVARAIREVKPDLVYTRHVPSAALACRRMRLVLEVHTPPTAVQRRLLADMFRRRGFLRLIVITHSLYDRVRLLYPDLSGDKIVVAPDAADLPETGQLDVVLPPAERPRVGYVGHLYPGKGMELIAQVAPRMPDVEFHVIGGRQHDVVHWRDRVGVAENVVFHGHVPPGRTGAYRAAMDILIAPYLRRVEHAGGADDIADWMSPLKLFEYMAAEKPIVASDMPAIREILSDREDALLASPGDVDAWVAALRTLVDRPELARSIATTAFERFKQQFTWNRRAESVMAGLEAEPGRGSK